MNRQLIEKALKANALAQKELEKQAAALQSMLNLQPHWADDLVPYAPRIQQALTFGAIVMADSGRYPSLVA